MHYLIYKITNSVNGKIYIGQHRTDNVDDGYMGSGLAIRGAINKYGVENFTKEILYDVENEELMDFLEELIVDEAFVAREDTYNLMVGGNGHFHTEEAKRKISHNQKGRPCYWKGKKQPEEMSRKKSASLKGKNKGKQPSEEARRKMSEAKKGKPAHNKGKPSPLKGRHLSEEVKQKLRKPKSEEARKHTSEAIKKWWAEKKGVA